MCSDSVAEFDSGVYPTWIVVESLLMLCILGGNTLTICAVAMRRRLARAPSSQFVVSLAVSDLLVGIFLPFHMSFYAIASLRVMELPCMLRLNLMVLAFCNSMYNLISISVDRYLYILHPLHYSAYVTQRSARAVIIFGWVYSITLASTPFFWNDWNQAKDCDYALVVPYQFTLYVLTPHFAAILLAMFVLYWRIWRVVAEVRRQWGSWHGKPSDTKSIVVVFMVLGSFTVLWLPLFLVLGLRLLCSRCFFPTTYSIAYQIVLSLAMANSSVNPIIYAWKNTEFTSAFSRLLRCKRPSYDSNPNAPTPRASLANIGGDLKGPLAKEIAKERCSDLV